jgi:hypothetical protein
MIDLTTDFFHKKTKHEILFLQQLTAHLYSIFL